MIKSALVRMTKVASHDSPAGSRSERVRISASNLVSNALQISVPDKRKVV